MPSLSPYRSDLDYAYAPGMFPAMECLLHRPDCARRVLLPAAVAPSLTPEVEVAQDINGSYWRDNSQTQPESGNSVFLGI